MTVALDTIGVRKDVHSITNDWRNRDSFCWSNAKNVNRYNISITISHCYLKLEVRAILKIENLTDCITMYFGYSC